LLAIVLPPAALAMAWSTRSSNAR